MSLWAAGAPLLSLGAEPVAATPSAEAATKAEAAKHEEHGLPPGSPGLGRTGSSFVTSSMVVTWTVGLGLILFARYATRKASAKDFLAA